MQELNNINADKGRAVEMWVEKTNKQQHTHFQKMGRMRNQFNTQK